MHFEINYLRIVSGIFNSISSSISVNENDYSRHNHRLIMCAICALLSFEDKQPRISAENFSRTNTLKM